MIDKQPKRNGWHAEKAGGFVHVQRHLGGALAGEWYLWKHEAVALARELWPEGAAVVDRAQAWSDAPLEPTDLATVATVASYDLLRAVEGATVESGDTDTRE